MTHTKKWRRLAEERVFQAPAPTTENSEETPSLTEEQRAILDRVEATAIKQSKKAHKADNTAVENP